MKIYQRMKHLWIAAAALFLGAATLPAQNPGPTPEEQKEKQLMEAIDRQTAYHEAFRDGHNCQRILDAVDDFCLNYLGRLRHKPLNLARKIIQRWDSRHL